jgi:hypothetical protein
VGPGLVARDVLYIDYVLHISSVDISDDQYQGGFLSRAGSIAPSRWASGWRVTCWGHLTAKCDGQDRVYIYIYIISTDPQP